MKRTHPMFKPDLTAPSGWHHLSPPRRWLLGLLTLGCLVPPFFMPVFRPALGLVAFQLACLSGVFLMRPQGHESRRHATGKPGLPVFLAVAAVFAAVVASATGF